MKKTLTINLAGYVFHIDEDAYYLLDNYIQNLHSYFSNESDADEIVHDMEQRISELFTEKLKENGREVISIADVESIISIIGKPEEMKVEDDQDYTKNESSYGSSCAKRKFYRNEDEKVFGGVCSGLAAYFGWDVTWVRIAVLLLGIFIHGTILAYIIAWIIIPPARTASEKLSMQGKTINVENIGKTVTDGFEKVKTKMDSPETRTTLQRIGDAFVACAGFFIKFILIIIAICCTPVILVLFVVFFVLIFVSSGLIAATPAMLTDLNFYVPMFNWTMIGNFSLETLALAISGILIIGIPIVGLIHMLMRYFGGWQPMSTTSKVVFLLLWFLSIGTGVYFALNNPLIAANTFSSIF